LIAGTNRRPLSHVLAMR